MIENRIFVDRDADVFSMVISFLRNGLDYPQIEDKCLMKRFNKELKFWGLPTQDDKYIDELQEIFDQEFEEEDLCEDTLKLRRLVGPFNVRKAIEEGKILLDSSINFVHDLKTGKKYNWMYSGQEPQQSRPYIGRLWCKDSVYEGVLMGEVPVKAELNRFGRHTSFMAVQEGIFEESALNGYGQEIDVDGTVREGHWEADRFLG